MRIDGKLGEKINNSISKYSGILAIFLKDKDEEYIYGENTLFDIGSLSKILTSMLVLKMNQDKLINLEDRLDKYLKVRDGNYPTIYELLSHRTGYHHLTPVKFTVPTLLFHRYKNYNLYSNITNQDVLKEINKRRKYKSEYGYSDFSYAILTLIIEEVYRDNFSNIMNYYLSSIGLLDTKCITKDMKRSAKKNWIWESNNPYISAGGIVSTISDIRKLILYIFDNVPEAFVKMDKHNCVFFLNDKQSVFWHVGGVGYYRVSLLLSKKRKIAVAVLGNHIGKRGANPYYISKLMYGALRRNKVHFE